MFPESAPQLPDKSSHLPPSERREGIVGDYFAPSREEREEHAREIAELEERVHTIEVHAASTMGKLGTLITGRQNGDALGRLYKQLRQLKENKRFRESREDVH